MPGYIKNSDGGYSVNYDDERFKDVKNEQVQKEQQLSETYNNMINNSDQYYNNQIQATKDYEIKQSELQQANTDFALQQIEQQKEQTEKDYNKEQKAAYVDYLKQTKSNAQNMANMGLSNSGYSESTMSSMYNTYQNRVGTARDVLNRNMMQFNNQIQQAILSNNEALAEIAYNSLQKQNELGQQAFEYKNNLILQRENQLQQLNEMYYARYQNVLAQINNEIQLQMELDRIDREYEQWLTEFNAKRDQWKQEFELQKQQAYASINASNAQAARYKTQTQTNNPYSSTNLSSAGQQVLKDIQNASKAVTKLRIWRNGK